MTPIVWADVSLTAALMLPLVGVPLWLIVNGPEARRMRAARIIRESELASAGAGAGAGNDSSR